MNILQKAYPLELEFKKNLRMAVMAGLFVTFFLFIFQPIKALYKESEMSLLITVVFGLITVLSMLFVTYLTPTFFKNYFKENKWTVLKEIIHSTLLIGLISLINFLYVYYFTNYNNTDISIVFYQVFGSTFLIAFFPLVGLVFYKQNLLLKKYLTDTETINNSIEKKQSKNKITVFGKGKNEQYEFDLKNLLFIKSQGNYCELFLKESLKPIVIRISLLQIQEQLKETKTYKCHRSYIVNIDNVSKVSGNAQGLRLHFDLIEESVPVSRNLSKETKQLLLNK